MRKIKNLCFSSATYHAYLLIQKFVLPHPFYRFFTDFTYVSALWHKSLIYQRLYKTLSPYAAKLNRNIRTITVPFFIYLLFPSLILPQSLFPLWQRLVSVLVIMLIAIRYAHLLRQRCDLLIFFIFCLVCIPGLYLILPVTAFLTIMQLVSSLMLYYIINGLITDKSSVSSAFKSLFILNLTICTVNLTSIIHDNGFINNPDNICDIIILTTPATLSYSLNLRSHSAQYPLGIFLLIITFLTIAFSKNTAALMGYSVAVLLFSALNSPRYLALIFLIFPGIVLFVLNKFLELCTPLFTNLGRVEGILYTAVNFWNKGISFGTNEFIRIYDKTIYQRNIPEHSRTFLQAGYVGLILVLWYTLKIIRTSIFNVFKAPADTRRVYLAILSSLIGFSASLLNKFSTFTFESSLCYWLLLGILSSQTKIHNLTLGKKKEL